MVLDNESGYSIYACLKCSDLHGNNYDSWVYFFNLEKGICHGVLTSQDFSNLEPSSYPYKSSIQAIYNSTSFDSNFGVTDENCKGSIEKCEIRNSDCSA